VVLGGREVMVWLSTAWSRILIWVECWWGGHLILAALNFHVWHIPIAGKTSMYLHAYVKVLHKFLLCTEG